MSGSGRGVVSAFFHNEKLRRFYVASRAVLVPIAIGALFCFARPEFFRLAFGISLFGELIQLWCFASLDKKRELACDGLYKFSRNPMYLGRYFIVLGYFVLLGNLYLIAAYTIFYYLYMWHRVQREEEVLIKLLGKPYEEYCRKVNRFMLTIPGMPGGKAWVWSWKLFNQNHGGINLLGMLVSYVVAWAWLFKLRDML